MPTTETRPQTYKPLRSDVSVVFDRPESEIFKRSAEEAPLVAELFLLYVRCMGHTIVNSEVYQKGDSYDMPPPVKMKDLSKALARAAVSRQERREMIARIKKDMTIQPQNLLGLNDIIGLPVIMHYGMQHGLTRGEAAEHALFVINQVSDSPHAGKMTKEPLPQEPRDPLKWRDKVAVALLDKIMPRPPKQKSTSSRARSAGSALGELLG